MSPCALSTNTYSHINTCKCAHTGGIHTLTHKRAFTPPSLAGAVVPWWKQCCSAQRHATRSGASARLPAMLVRPLPAAKLARSLLLQIQPQLVAAAGAAAVAAGRAWRARAGALVWQAKPRSRRLSQRRGGIVRLRGRAHCYVGAQWMRSCCGWWSATWWSGCCSSHRCRGRAGGSNHTSGSSIRGHTSAKRSWRGSKGGSRAPRKVRRRRGLKKTMRGGRGTLRLWARRGATVAAVAFTAMATPGWRAWPCTHIVAYSWVGDGT